MTRRVTPGQGSEQSGHLKKPAGDLETREANKHHAWSTHSDTYKYSHIPALLERHKHHQARNRASEASRAQSRLQREPASGRGVPERSISGKPATEADQPGKDGAPRSRQRGDPADDAVQDGPVPSLPPGGARAAHALPLLRQRAAAARRRVLLAARHQGRPPHHGGHGRVRHRAGVPGDPRHLDAGAGRGLEAHRRRRPPQGRHLLLPDLARRQSLHQR